MEFRVKIVVDAKKEGVRELSDGRLLVSVRAPRKEGRANGRLCEILALHFGVSVDAVSIVRGYTQSTKTVHIK